MRVETERSREQRENTQHLMTMLERLIAKATTPEQKSEYEAELELLMRQAVAQAKLKAHVASSSSAALGATAASGEPSALGATAASGEQDTEQGSPSTGAETKAAAPGALGATAASGEQDPEQCSPSTGAETKAAAPGALGATAASGEQDPEQCSSSTGAETKAAAPGEQDPEQGSPGAETKAAAKKIVLPSFWQALNKILENHDNWIDEKRQELKKYGLFAQSDPQVEADASEEFDVLNENLKHLQHLQVLVRHPLI
jgi:hypothetical protein